MADNVLFTPLRALDANNVPIAGARAYFFRTGTSTPETVYQNKAATTPHSNPVLADSNGVFPLVYASGNYILRCIIRDTDEVEVSDIDPIWSTPLTSGAASSITFAPTVDVAQENVQDAIEEVQANWTGAKSGSDDAIISGTAGTDGNLVSWNEDGDAVDSGYGVIDEDDMSSDDDSAVPTQQSVKAYVDAGFAARRFTSTAQTITTGGLLTIAHGLGATPRHVNYRLVCTTDDAGYVVGDEILIGDNNTNGSQSRFSTPRVDATNIYVRFSSTTNVFAAGNKGTGSFESLTNGSWDMFIEATI